MYDLNNWYGRRVLIPYQDYGFKQLELDIYHIIDKYTLMGNYLTHYIALPAEKHQAVKTLRELADYIEKEFNV